MKNLQPLLLVIMLKHMLSCKKDFCILEKDWKSLDNRMSLMNKDRQHYGFTVGQIVYMYNPSGSQLQTW